MADIKPGSLPPLIEFFYAYDTVGPKKGMISARCVAWDDPQYRHLLDSWEPQYSTVGYSRRSWSPHQVAVEMVRILARDFTTPQSYLLFLSDIAGLAERGMIPAYCAPILLAAADMGTFHERVGKASIAFEPETDELVRRFTKTFAAFLAREHVNSRLRDTPEAKALDIE